MLTKCLCLTPSTHTLNGIVSQTSNTHAGCLSNELAHLLACCYPTPFAAIDECVCACLFFNVHPLNLFGQCMSVTIQAAGTETFKHNGSLPHCHRRLSCISTPERCPLVSWKRHCLNMGVRCMQIEESEETIVLLLSARTCLHLVVVLGGALNKYPYTSQQLPPLSLSSRWQG